MTGALVKDLSRRDLFLGTAAAFLPVRGGHANEVPGLIAPLREPEATLVLGDRRIALPSRGHGIALHPSAPLALLFARRPGRYALLFDRESGAVEAWIAAAAGRHFYGHGAVSPDGRLLYASEQAYETATGLLGVYDLHDGARRLGEIETGGIGPHDLLLMPDGETLLVANGGIETHPDLGRAKLNLASMAPSLARIDRGSGRLLGQTALPPRLHQLSLRHLALDGLGQPWVAAQYEGNPLDAVPLAFRLSSDGALLPLPAPSAGWAGLAGYAASIAAAPRAGLMALTAPRAQQVLLWSEDDPSRQRPVALPPPFGIAGADRGFLVTSADGGIYRLDPSGGSRAILPPGGGRVWDNHAYCGA